MLPPRPQRATVRLFRARTADPTRVGRLNCDPPSRFPEKPDEDIPGPVVTTVAVRVLVDRDGIAHSVEITVDGGERAGWLAVAIMTTTPEVARGLGRIVTLPPAGPGQFGPAHTVVEVLAGESYGDTDPFILLMDDRIDGTPMGGAHPHAGFETVTLMLEGVLKHDHGEVKPGGMQWMTAGSGVTHGEALEAPGSGRARLLQLWLTLPKAARWAPPGVQDQDYEDLPVRREPGVEVRVYSGRSGGVVSKTLNHVPVTMVELRLEPGASVSQELPASFNGFFYVLEGEIAVGSESQTLRPGQVGWLDRPAHREPSAVRVTGTGPQAARVILYAGEPQGDPLVSWGPFIGDTQADIARVSAEYRAGKYGPPPPRVP